MLKKKLDFQYGWILYDQKQNAWQIVTQCQKKFSDIFWLL